MIYIAGKYHGNSTRELLANIDLAKEYGQIVLALGLVPFVPHILGYSLSRNSIFQQWDSYDWLKHFCLPMLKHCDALLLIPGWEESRGAIIEREFAKNNKIKIFESLNELKKKIKSFRNKINFEKYLGEYGEVTFKHDLETRQKISRAKKGSKLSEIHKNRIRARMKH